MEAFEPGQDYLITKDLHVVVSPAADDFSKMAADAIGGFHTLCADAGIIPGHPLNGFRAGDILPQSLWNWTHRPDCPDPRGFVYDPQTDIWVRIYIEQGADGILLMNYDEYVAYGQSRGWRLLTHDEFSSIAAGSNEMTNISGSTRPERSGGHVDMLGRRMISNIGCEDCCGVIWQYLGDFSLINKENPLLAGAYWDGGAHSGSRARYAYYSRWSTYSGIGARFGSEPRHPRSSTCMMSEGNE